MHTLRLIQKFFFGLLLIIVWDPVLPGAMADEFIPIHIADKFAVLFFDKIHGQAITLSYPGNNGRMEIAGYKSPVKSWSVEVPALAESNICDVRDDEMYYITGGVDPESKNYLCNYNSLALSTGNTKQLFTTTTSNGLFLSVCQCSHLLIGSQSRLTLLQPFATGNNQDGSDGFGLSFEQQSGSEVYRVDVPATSLPKNPFNNILNFLNFDHPFTLSDGSIVYSYLREVERGKNSYADFIVTLWFPKENQFKEFDLSEMIIATTPPNDGTINNIYPANEDQIVYKVVYEVRDHHIAKYFLLSILSGEFEEIGEEDARPYILATDSSQTDTIDDQCSVSEKYARLIRGGKLSYNIQLSNGDGLSSGGYYLKRRKTRLSKPFCVSTKIFPVGSCSKLFSSFSNENGTFFVPKPDTAQPIHDCTFKVELRNRSDENILPFDLLMTDQFGKSRPLHFSDKLTASFSTKIDVNNQCEGPNLSGLYKKKSVHPIFKFIWREHCA